MSEQTTIGVDLGGTKMLVGALSGTEILCSASEPSTELSEEQLVDQLVRMVGEARDAHPEVVAVGLGIPATIRHETGVAVSAVNLPLDDLPIREIVAERVGLPVFVDNDGNVAALAEYLYGAGRGADDMVLLTIGTGIGGGLILKGEPYRGATGAGAELGHVVVDVNGPPCQGNCRGRGCVETMASGTAIGREGREAAGREPDSALGALAAQGETIDGKAVTELALAGDPGAIGVFRKVGTNLGAALVSFANIFEPRVIVIGGGAMAAGDLLLDPARKMLRDRALRPMDETPVVAAELGPEAGLIGAAALARIELGRSGA